MLKRLFVGLGLILALASCATTGGQSDLKVSFDEFQKILTPRSMVLLEGEGAILWREFYFLRPGENPDSYLFPQKKNRFWQITAVEKAICCSQTFFVFARLQCQNDF